VIEKARQANINYPPVQQEIGGSNFQILLVIKIINTLFYHLPLGKKNKGKEIFAAVLKII